MLLNIASLVIILLITFYMATQGMLTSLIALVTAVFGSILAMGLVEPLQGIARSIMSGNYAYGVTFLAIFLGGFGATRVIADIVVPNNIKLPQLVNSIVGGTLGFFTGLVVIGTLVIGMETLPLPKVMMGFDRFPPNSAVDGEADAQAAAGGASLWFGPERLTMAIWKGVSGRALGGAQPWTQKHPDFFAEAYRYRR